MKRVYVLAIALIISAYMPVYATIINIPDDYPTIQEGIDASTDGDTVLVQPGTYVENINFNGHNIVVASFFLIDGNPENISNTIIDGDSSGSVVTTISNDSTAIITGFTLQNGYRIKGAGIYCEFSNLMIVHNIIKWNGSNVSGNWGGGIYCIESDPTIRSNLIIGNSACWGGGIGLDNSNPIISNNNITENSADP